MEVVPLPATLEMWKSGPDRSSLDLVLGVLVAVASLSVV
jgi:hypothetical protein